MNRPIKSSGRYNLNFIDPANEYPTDQRSYQLLLKYVHKASYTSPKLALRTRKASKQQLCPICLITLKEGDEVGKIACGHQFHFECLREWVQQNQSCPTCRANLSEG